MQRIRASPGAAAKVKKKMTKEQMQLAIIKKKECDAKALNIVMQLLEPKVDPVWLLQNLKDINRCHMEDAIEERAITKLCGYVLCQKSITVVMNQRYHISLKDKKVYDVTKRKNFCSSGCFGASNYLLEQMLTSPLWLRDKEEIPKFRIFTKNNLNANSSHGEEVDITIIKPCSTNDVENMKETEDIAKEKRLSNDNSENDTDQRNEETSIESLKNEVSKSIENFVLETVRNMHVQNTNQTESPETESPKSVVVNNGQNNKIEKSTKKVQFQDKLSENELSTDLESSKSEKEISENENDTRNFIPQHNHFVEPFKNEANAEMSTEEKNINKNTNDSINVIQSDKTSQSDVNEDVKPLKNNETQYKIDEDKAGELQSTEAQIEGINKQGEKTKVVRKKKRTEKKVIEVVNLAARIEQSLQEWITEETIHFLFGDDSVKQKAIEKIETQDRYSILCQKLNKLQFQDEQEDNEILEKPALKPAPHFAVLQEEGQKLELKVRAFYHGKTSVEEPKKVATTQEDSVNLDTFLPLTDIYAPHTLRRKIFLERLDQVLPDLLRTLAGNNEVYAKASLSYTSMRCTAVKALVHTFSLSAKNIIFKTAEWTLVGLVIIKMLSLLDPWLANLLITKQANMYISMILTSYKLDPHYLNLLVISYNPNVNPR